MQYPEDPELLLFLPWDQICPRRQSEPSSGNFRPQSLSPQSPAPPKSTVTEPVQSAVPQSVPPPDNDPGAEGICHHHGQWYCLTVSCLKRPNGWKSEKNAIHHVRMHHLGKEPLQCPWPGWYVCLSSVTRSKTNFIQ